MDPLSITTGCVTLIATVGKTSLTVVNFIKKCREARADLTSVNRELSELCLVLEILREDTAEDDSVIPSSVQNQILSIISSCSDVLSRIGSALTKHHGRTAPIRWAIDGSDSIQNLRQLLEGHRGALSLAVDTVALYAWATNGVTSAADLFIPGLRPGKLRGIPRRFAPMQSK